MRRRPWKGPISACRVTVCDRVCGGRRLTVCKNVCVCVWISLCACRFVRARAANRAAMGSAEKDAAGGGSGRDSGGDPRAPADAVGKVAALASAATTAPVKAVATLAVGGGEAGGRVVAGTTAPVAALVLPAAVERANTLTPATVVEDWDGRV